jgi:hypothetical protein
VTQPYQHGPQQPVNAPQQMAPQTYPGPYGAPPPTNPGKGLGVAGLICGILLGPGAFIGLILSIVGLRKSKKSGFSNGVAVAGIVISSLAFVVWVIIITVMIVGLIAVASKCAELGPGIHQIGGVTYTCG